MSPENPRDPEEQAFLGATGEHLARRWNLAIPRHNWGQA
jgi:hypothetical protein